MDNNRPVPPPPPEETYHRRRRRGAILFRRALFRIILLAIVALFIILGWNIIREKAFDAFLQSTPGNRFPELWFEIPLLGDPWFDLHVLTAAKDLPKDRILPQERCAGYADTFQWFSKQMHVRQLALSWDLNIF